MWQKSLMFHRLYDWKVHKFFNSCVKNGLYILLTQRNSFSYIAKIFIGYVYRSSELTVFSIVIQFHDLIYCEQYKINLPIFFVFTSIEWRCVHNLFKSQKKKRNDTVYTFCEFIVQNSSNLNNRISALFSQILRIFIFKLFL